MKENSDSTPKKRGGKRPGAGRPRNDSKLYTFRAPGPMAKILDSQENRTDFIRNCITKTIAPVLLACKARTKTITLISTDGDIDSDLSKLGDVIPAVNVKEMTLPYFDISLVAGFPVPLDNDEKSQDIDILRMLCPYPESSYLIRVQGNSMIDAGIHDGDIVIVDKSNRSPEESEVAVCELNGEYTLKRFVKRDGKGWLVPANPEFPEIEVTENDTFSIWGTVTYIIHKPINKNRNIGQ